MNCTACGAANRAGRRFCGQCGASLDRLCPSCGAANEEGERFCGACGASLGLSPAVPEPVHLNAYRPAQTAVSARPAAERRHVSVLFADLVGFTPLSDQRDAEDVRELLSGYFSTARTIIGRYGGTVEKFIGDAVMAVWGVESVQENDAERAVRAALELVDAVAVFGDQAGAPGLRARAGVLTGEAAVSFGDNGEGSVAGDLVNTASRVQSVAEPGTVFVGDGTREASEAAIVYENAGAYELKGKPEPVHLWRAARVVAAFGGALRPTGLEPPFVGRDRELRLLKELLHGTGEEATARLMSITGVAGVGKSRLAWEFFKYVDGLTETIWWHRGRCLAYGEGVAYWALNEMVRMRAGIIENEPPESARAKLRASVEEFVSDPEERRWVEPRLAHLVGLEEGVASDPRDLYAAWRFFFERLAAQHVTVLVFEDLQWADSGLLDFIEYLLEWSRSSPILVITLARPEMNDRRPGWGTGKRGLSSLYLDPLSPDAMEQLLEGIVPGLPADLSERIRDRAAGIPLYAVETVRMLLDRGLVVEEGGRFRAQGSLEALEVPESLHALIAARLDSLGTPERQLLQDAAVLGKSFTAHAITAISGLDPTEVTRILSSLVSKDLLAIQSDPRSPERGQYVFVQDLVRSVAYGTLARRDRKLRHVAAATYLESEWSEEEEVAEVVAAHLVEAHAADPDADDAAEIRERARAALIRAGDHAVSLAAAESAQGYYERALTLSDDELSRAGLHAKAGETANRRGQNAAARQHYESATALYDGLGRTTDSARILSLLARVDLMERHGDEGLARMRRAFTMLAGGDPDDWAREAELASVAAHLSKQLFFHGDLDEALAFAERALQIAETGGLHEALANALDARACVLGAQGRRDEAELLLQGALRVALEHNVTADRVRIILQDLASTLEEADRLDDCLDYYEQGETLARRLGNRPGAVTARLTRGNALLELGRWDEFAALYAQYLETDASELGAVPWILGMGVDMALLFVRRGDIPAARAVVAEKATALEDAHVEMRGVYDAARAAVAIAEGHPAEALAASERGLTSSLELSFPVVACQNLVEAVDAAFALGRDDKVAELIALVRGHYRPGRQRSIDAHIHRWQAMLAARRGDDAAAVASFELAVEAFTALTRPFWLAVTRVEYAELLMRQDRDAEAAALLIQARSAFAQLGARPWVDRVDAAARTSGASPSEARSTA
ncbi:MAG: adenylate/guanylate cyclase domain-containing protein [Candidatus Dormiibacterota bacterium]